MKRMFLNGILITMVLIVTVGLIARTGYTQITSLWPSLNMPYFGVTSMISPSISTSYYGPFWGAQAGQAAIPLASSQWPIAMATKPAPAGLTGYGYGYGITGFSLLPSMGTFAGLGTTSFGSVNAISTMGMPWNYMPYFGLAPYGPGFYYPLGYTPWWGSY